MARLIAGQRFDINIFADGRVDQAGYIAAGLAALPGNLQGAGQDPVDLHDCVRLEPWPASQV